jgi:hypothetical protein
VRRTILALMLIGRYDALEIAEIWSYGRPHRVFVVNPDGARSATATLA